nr:hypothetical protein [Mycoplasma haemofelis]
MASKYVMPSVALASGGAGAAGVGGYIALTKDKETFRSKYSKAILGEKDSLWDTKFEALKGNGTPVNKKLLDAKSKHSSDANAAKALHKQGCSEIYNSLVAESTYLEDFKSYCAKTIKDGISKPETWISQEETQNNGKWDPKLTALKDHDEKKLGSLDETLKALKNKLTSGSTSSWDADKRNGLKNWCKGIGGEIFEGEESVKFSHAKLYCTDNAG